MASLVSLVNVLLIAILLGLLAPSIMAKKLEGPCPYDSESGHWHCHHHKHNQPSRSLKSSADSQPYLEKPYKLPPLLPDAPANSQPQSPPPPEHHISPSPSPPAHRKRSPKTAPAPKQMHPPPASTSTSTSIDTTIIINNPPDVKPPPKQEAQASTPLPAPKQTSYAAGLVLSSAWLILILGGLFL